MRFGGATVAKSHDEVMDEVHLESSGYSQFFISQLPYHSWVTLIPWLTHGTSTVCKWRAHHRLLRGISEGERGKTMGKPGDFRGKTGEFQEYSMDKTGYFV